MSAMRLVFTEEQSELLIWTAKAAIRMHSEFFMFEGWEKAMGTKSDRVKDILSAQKKFERAVRLIQAAHQRAKRIAENNKEFEIK